MRVSGAYGALVKASSRILWRRIVQLTLQRPVVTFCFDDFPRTALSCAGDILSRSGCHGTYYASAGLVNTTTELGEQFRQEDLADLLEEGHELGSHTCHHTSCRSVPFEAFVQDVWDGCKALEDMIGSAVSRNFAYPYGDVTLNSKRALTGMTSCRGIYSGMNGPAVDLNLLKACALYGGTEQLNRIEEIVGTAEKYNRWLIFYTHDVRQKPSRFGCTPGLLESTLSFVLERVVPVRSVQEVLEDQALFPSLNTSLQNGT